MEVLTLRNTKITDAGLKDLASLGSLQFLDLEDNPQLTDAAVAAPKKALPDLRVVGP